MLKSEEIMFKSTLLFGVKYALLFFALAGLMGAIFGLFGGIFVSPALAFITIVGVFVILNFLVAVVVQIINLLLYPFKKSSKKITKYFTYSLSFLFVFGLYFLFMKYSNIQVF
jgi:hypothetical protein